MKKELTLEEMKAQLRANSEKAQNEFIDKIYNDLLWLSEKAIKKDYEPTDHERQRLANIKTLVNGMNEWF